MALAISAPPLSPRQIVARARRADGIGSGLESDISLARRSSRRAAPAPLHDPYGAGIATPALNASAVRVLAILGG